VTKEFNRQYQERLTETTLLKNNLDIDIGDNINHPPSPRYSPKD
jgi:hypothetical protein